MSNDASLSAAGAKIVPLPFSHGSSPRRILAHCLLVAVAVSAVGCSGARSPLPTVPRIDLERFMGPWYVIAHIPAGAEKNAFDAVETYRLAEDGSIETTYVFREGGHDGPEKRLTPRGFVRDRTTNATWGMQFAWPLRLEYLVAHVDPDYSETIIARTARDYVWIMARLPDLAEADYARLVGRVAELGYDVGKLRRVPHRGVPASEPRASGAGVGSSMRRIRPVLLGSSQSK